MSKIKNKDLDRELPLDEVGDDEAVRAAIKVSLIVLGSLMFVAVIGYSVYFFAFLSSFLTPPFVCVCFPFLLCGRS